MSTFSRSNPRKSTGFHRQMRDVILCLSHNRLFHSHLSTWLLLVPVLAITNSVDIAHHVVSSVSVNSAASSGYFVGTPWVVVPFAIYMALKGAWGIFNYWKMAAIKSMLVPRLELDPLDNTVRIIPPRVESPEARQSFHSTPNFLKPLEDLFRELPTTRVEELFGHVGKGGPAFYLESIKLHTWICVASLIGFGAQIIPRDLFVLANPDQMAHAGRPDLLVPEISFFSLIVVFNLFQLWLAPKTFLNFCLIECVNNLVSANEGNHSASPVQANKHLSPSTLSNKTAASFESTTDSPKRTKDPAPQQVADVRYSKRKMLAKALSSRFRRRSPLDTTLVTSSTETEDEFVLEDA